MERMNLALNLRTGSSTALLLTPPAPRGTLVLAHGAGNDRSYSFAPFFEAAQRMGFQVLSLDLPGHGRGNTSVFEVDRVVSDVAEAIMQARTLSPHGDRPWLLVGNSLGGALALRAAAEADLRPAGVIGIGMPTQFQLGLQSVFGEFPSLLSPAMLRYRRYVESWREVFPAFGGFRRDDFPVRSDRPVYLDAVAAVLNRPWSTFRPDFPILLVQGRRDAVARLADTQRWVDATRARGADVTLEVLRQVGHLDVMLHARLHAAVLGWAWDRIAENP
ncbi:2-succinyl-6-hydroxy-2,4-cyclohexadiene-1-carboxylate synthase [compost metagenome]